MRSLLERSPALPRYDPPAAPPRRDSEELVDVLVDFDALPWHSPGPGIRFKAFAGGPQQVRILELSEGFEEAEWCRKAHGVHVLEGAFTLRLRDRELRLRAGDVAVLASAPEHAHKACVGPGERVRLLLFEP